ncbi:protein starmaker-like [Aricia agestis]|uniref:protein starmaker-like n=1 Tax=Aricia agestis TaxID=91739 RepID=UPI001C206B74|nr:protein starmaker-like [Aricia agestis]
MSQMVTRKGPVGEDKEKRQTDSPVKDMKKKIAANAEKEKQTGEKVPEKHQNDKNSEKLDKSIDKDKKDAKPAEKTDKKDAKTVEKTEKKDAKSPEKLDKKDAKSAEKTDKKDTKPAEKTEKKDVKIAEKSDKKEKEKSVEKDKKEKTTDKRDKADKSPEKKDRADKKDDKKDEVKERNGKPEHKEAKQNGTRNGDHEASSEDDELERDELFPELAYDDSDVEVVEGLPSRSTTRRDQVKATRTPETPRPASDKRPEPDAESKEKVLKLQDSLATDRKLRSADSPKPANVDQQDKMELDEVESEERRKPDTNYSRSRARVSPYRRAAPPSAVAPPHAPSAADVTACSAQADYTGNNTTMETDMELSVSEAPESPYLSGLRTIRGRRSYKPLREMTLRNIVPRPPRPAPTLASEPIRPMAPVVGRKRKPDDVEVAVDALAETKRPRLLQRLARPFRALAARQPEIVGINTDLPMTAPVACADFDPEVIKAEDTDTVDQIDHAKDQRDQIPVPTSRLVPQDNKRCVIV